MLHSKQQLRICVAALLLALTPVYAQATGMQAGGMGQSVPTVDDNSGAIKSNTENIAQYLKDLKEFFGAGSNDPLKNGQGLNSSDLNGSGEKGFNNIESLNSKKIVEERLLDSSSLTSEAVRKYYGISDLTSNLCTQATLSGRVVSDAKTRMAQACNSARNMVALQQAEIFQIIEMLEKRNSKLQAFLNQGYNNSGDVQQKQYQIAVMQALIQNDMARLQASIAAYENKIAFYKQIQAEAERSILYGDKPNLTSSLASDLSSFAVGAGTMALVEDTGFLDTLVGVVSRAYDSIKNKLGITD